MEAEIGELETEEDRKAREVFNRITENYCPTEPHPLGNHQHSWTTAPDLKYRCWWCRAKRDSIQ